MLYTPVTKNAIRFCYQAHAGQLDKAGLPYVNHRFTLRSRCPPRTRPASRFSMT